MRITFACAFSFFFFFCAGFCAFFELCGGRTESVVLGDNHTNISAIYVVRSTVCSRVLHRAFMSGYVKFEFIHPQQNVVYGSLLGPVPEPTSLIYTRRRPWLSASARRPVTLLHHPVHRQEGEGDRLIEHLYCIWCLFPFDRVA